MKSRFIKACEKKLKMMKGKVIIPCVTCLGRICCALKEAEVIPKDVPKGHFVVYVGEEEYKRFVIKITLLKHPLFQALLNQAQDAYGFSADSRLRIPCDESTFHDVVRCTGAPYSQKNCICI